jgi:hypothetical protein
LFLAVRERPLEFETVEAWQPYVKHKAGGQVGRFPLEIVLRRGEGLCWQACGRNSREKLRRMASSSSTMDTSTSGCRFNERETFEGTITRTIGNLHTDRHSVKLAIRRFKLLFVPAS